MAKIVGTAGGKIIGKSPLLAPQIFTKSNFDPQLQNRPVPVPQLPKPFTFSTYSDFGGFHLTWQMLTGIDPMTWTDRALVL